MTTYTAISIERTYKNNGIHAQQVVDFTLTGQIRKADNRKWNEGSDIPELLMSVKTDRFTLASDLAGETICEKIEDYFNRVRSVNWAYLANNGTIYIMNRSEFKAFLLRFAKLEKDSTKNGGRMKVRFPHETEMVRQWLMAQI